MKKIVLLLTIILLFGCGKMPNIEKENTTRTNEEVIQPIRYKVVGTCHQVEKMVIEGHEYLVFSSRLANPPNVIHSKSCPCHND